MRKNLVKKIALYFCVLVVLFSVLCCFAVVCEAPDLDGKNYYATQQFSNELESTVGGVLMEQDSLSRTSDKRDNDIIYSVASYYDVTSGKKMNPEAVSQNIRWKEEKDNNSDLESNYYDGYDAGSEHFIFYSPFSQLLDDNRQMHPDIGKSYVRLSKEEYLSLLEKYLSIEGGLKNIKKEYDFQYQDKNVRCFPTELSVGITVNEKFDYSYSAIQSGDDLYFVKEFLDFSSKENFDKSIITTPFCNSRYALDYLALKEDISRISDCDYYYYHNSWKNSQINYKIVTKDGKILGSNDNIKTKKTITFYTDTRSLDENNKKELAHKNLLVSDVIFDMLEDYGIKSMQVEIPDFHDWFNLFTVSSFIYSVSQKMFFVVVMGLFSLLLSVILLIQIVKKEQYEELSRYDRKCLEIRTIISTVLLSVIIISAVMILSLVMEFAYDYRIQLQPLILFFGLAAVWFLNVLIMQYIISIFRRKKHPGKPQSVIYTFVKKNTKEFLEWIQALHEDSSYVRRFILFFVFFCVLNLLASAFSIVGVALVFLLDVYIGARIYQSKRKLDQISDGVKRIAEGDLEYQLEESLTTGEYKSMALAVNQIGEGLEQAVSASIRDERLKAELITNVSHDIKTPLTSIINYVDLIKRENIKEEPLKEYIDVFGRKSQRLKRLIEDLVEVSKANTGNIELVCTNLDMRQLAIQAVGEFEDKLLEKKLEAVLDVGETPQIICADGRRCYRIIENLLSNVCKYSLSGTRVYVSLKTEGKDIILCIRNISETPLNIDPEELTQRFVRGEESRTKEGSGLGLSIAKSLTELQKGQFRIDIDGDLFKVTVAFPGIAKEF